MSLAVASARYRPRSPRRAPLYELVLDHHERFEAVHEETYASRYGPLRSHVRDTLLRYLDCGDFSNGFLRVACSRPGCGHEVLVPFSCKRAICPSCAQRRSLEFAEFVNAEVLGQVPYLHVVFTIPKLLRPAFLRDRGLLRELGHCAWKTLCRGLRVAVGVRLARPGAVIARATAGDLGNPHPHLHVIVSCGAWTERGRGDRFLAWPSYLTGEQLEPLFRRKVLALLLKRERLAPSTAERLMQWSPSGFSVWVGQPIEPQEVESRLRLARYLVKPSVALDRMDYDPERCEVTYRSVSQGRRRTMTALDFMADLAVHIPDPGEHGVSYVGRCSNRSRGMRRKAALTQTEPSRPPPPPPLSRKAFRAAWAQLLQKVWSVDVSRCPRCGSSVRILCAVLQVTSIRRILDHLGIPKPRPPNAHNCLPPPGSQLCLPTVSVKAPQPPVAPEDERDPRLDDEWPVDAPFEEE